VGKRAANASFFKAALEQGGSYVFWWHIGFGAASLARFCTRHVRRTFWLENKIAFVLHRCTFAAFEIEAKFATNEKQRDYFCPFGSRDTNARYKFEPKF
jgi:hypothetical protein